MCSLFSENARVFSFKKTNYKCAAILWICAVVASNCAVNMLVKVKINKTVIFQVAMRSTEGKGMEAGYGFF